MSSIPIHHLHPFEHFVNQIGLAADRNDLYFVALMSALALPDICGALESSDGLATGKKYKDWFDKWVSSKYQINGAPSLTGHDCYMLRCASIHQGRLVHPNASYEGVIFIEPGHTGIIMHNNIFNNFLNIDARQFCVDVIQSSLDWFDRVNGTKPFDDNYQKSMQRYENGFGPIGGVPVIA